MVEVTSASSGQPAGQQAPPSSSPGAPDSTAATRQIRPIPNQANKSHPGEIQAGTEDTRGERAKKRADRPTLPGVVSRHEGDELFINRDKSGRFTSRDAQEDAFEREILGHDDDEHDGVGEIGKALVTRPDTREGEGEAPKPPLPKQEEAAPVKLKYRGKEVTLDEIEQRHKSLEGMFGSLNKEKTTLTEERDYGYKAAHAWKEKAEAAEQELARIRGGGQAPPPTQNPNVATSPRQGGIPTKEELLSSVNVEAFEQAAIQGGLPYAAKLLSEQLFEAMLSKVVPALQQDYQTKLQPFEDVQQHNAAVAQAGGLVRSISEMKDLAGNDAFPEARDPQKLVEIGNLWVGSGRNPQDVLTREGLMAAIAFHRMMTAFPSEAPAASTGGPQFQTGSPGPAASVFAEPGGMQPSNSGRSHLSAEARQLHDALSRSEMGVDPVLGFPRGRNR